MDKLPGGIWSNAAAFLSQSKSKWLIVLCHKDSANLSHHVSWVRNLEENLLLLFLTQTGILMPGDINNCKKMMFFFSTRQAFLKYQFWNILYQCARINEKHTLEKKTQQPTNAECCGGRVGLLKPVDFQHRAKVRLVLACLSAFTEKHA